MGCHALLEGVFSTQDINVVSRTKQVLVNCCSVMLVVVVISYTSNLCFLSFSLGLSLASCHLIKDYIFNTPPTPAPGFDFVIISHHWNVGKSDVYYFLGHTLKKQGCFSCFLLSLGIEDYEALNGRTKRHKRLSKIITWRRATTQSGVPELDHYLRMNSISAASSHWHVRDYMLYLGSP